MGVFAPIFLFYGRGLRLFFILEVTMEKKIRDITYAAIIAAAYVALTHLQNMLLPGTATMAIQFRASEALCVLAFFTPAAVPGLTVGCMIFNLTSGAALPFDFLVGSAATLLAVGGMWLLRDVKLLGLPVLGLLLPALTNAVLVGGELTVCIGGGFLINALYVAIGEAAVLLTLGALLYVAIRKRGLDKRLFG